MKLWVSFLYLFSIRPNHGCLGKVRGHAEMDGLHCNCNKTKPYCRRFSRSAASIMGVTSADIEAKRIWIMITNACAMIRMMNVVIIVYFYAMIYHGIRQRRTSDKVMLHETIHNDDFRATQRCNIVATLFRMVATLFQHCNAVLC